MGDFSWEFRDEFYLQKGCAVYCANLPLRVRVMRLVWATLVFMSHDFPLRRRARKEFLEEKIHSVFRKSLVYRFPIV